MRKLTNLGSKKKVEEKLIKTEQFDVFITTSPYEVKDRLLSNYYKEDVRIYIDETVPIYFIGFAYETTHSDMMKAVNEAEGYNLNWDDYSDKKICLIYVPKSVDEYMTSEEEYQSDEYDTVYEYDTFWLYTRYQDFTKFKLYRLLGHPIDVYDISLEYNESLKEARQKQPNWDDMEYLGQEYFDDKMSINEAKNIMWRWNLNQPASKNLWLYHGTSEKGYKKIVQQGLIKAKKSYGYNGNLFGKVVYLTSSEDDAAEYVFRMHDSDAMVIEIDVNKIDLNKLYIDTNEEYGTYKDPETGKIYYDFYDFVYLGDIPKEAWKGNYTLDLLDESKQDTQKFIDWAGESAANKFYKLKDRLQGKQKDIYYWMGLEKELGKHGAVQELLAALNELDRTPTKKERNVAAKEGSSKIYEDSKWLVLAIDTYEASVKYGKGTKWCITSYYEDEGRDYFERESDGGQNSFYFYIPKQPRYNNEKYCLKYIDDDNWVLFDDEDYVEICSEEFEDNVVELWSPFDTGGRCPNFPDIDGLPDLNREYDRRAKAAGWEKELIREAYLDKEEKFWDYGTGDVVGDDIFDTSKTEMTFFTQAIPGHKDYEYMKNNKNLEGKIVQMSPNEYYEECAKIFNTTKENLIDQRSWDKDTLEHLKQVLTVYKKKFPITTINYAERSQEGLHRMLVAGELYGWDHKFPVLTIDWYDKELRKKQIAYKKRLELEEALEKVLRRLHAVYDEFDDYYDLKSTLERMLKNEIDNSKINIKVEFNFDDSTYTVFADDVFTTKDLDEFVVLEDDDFLDDLDIDDLEA